MRGCVHACESEILSQTCWIDVNPMYPAKAKRNTGQAHHTARCGRCWCVREVGLVLSLQV